MMLSLFAALLTAPTWTVRQDVEYAQVAGESLKMDLYRPQSAGASNLPAVLVIHGGAWMAGKRQDMADLCRLIADNGMVAATVSYRLAPRHPWPAMLDDVQTAVRFLRHRAKDFGIDGTRIGAAGASAGGHLAVFLGVRDTRDAGTKLYPNHSSRVAAVFDIFGPIDLGSPDFPPTLDPAFALVLGKPRKDAAKEIRDASPIHFVDRKSAPVFIYQGLNDPLVPASQSRLLESRYRQLGLTVEARYLEGIGHEVKPDHPASRQAILEGIRFLARHLRVD
ncbi:MAG: alpha/beta hydrolase [Fimbriimonadales bacterium]|nr:alpha/beta hydrolase [Fimbriimonadales bacterium]